MKQLDTRINEYGLKRRRYRVAPGVTTVTVEVPEALFKRLGARVLQDLARAQRMLQMRVRNERIIELRQAGNKVLAIASETGVSEHVVWDVIRRNKKC
ncbi:MAG: hypothetical protein YHS30scaffold667_56 [Phage 65_10]|nr:MAG: hypothetical protein YHS30scaffold667_56 [Phage 65_10]